MPVNPYLTAAQRAVLEHAKIGVAGLGGLDSNVLNHLVRAGLRPGSASPPPSKPTPCRKR